MAVRPSKEVRSEAKNWREDFGAERKIEGKIQPVQTRESEPADELEIARGVRTAGDGR